MHIQKINMCVLNPSAGFFLLICSLFIILGEISTTNLYISVLWVWVLLQKLETEIFF